MSWKNIVIVCCTIFFPIAFSQIGKLPQSGLLPPAYELSAAGMRKLFLNPPDDSRVMMRWWWFGPAVSRPELEREMRLMKEGGIGGFEVQPVYPLLWMMLPQESRTFHYLSDASSMASFHLGKGARSRVCARI